MRQHCVEFACCVRQKKTQKTKKKKKKSKIKSFTFNSNDDDSQLTYTDKWPRINKQKKKDEKKNQAKKISN